MVRHQPLLIIVLIIAAMILSGCAALLPRSSSVTKSPWNSYKEVVDAYEKVIPNTSTANDIQKLGFDIYSTPNLKILSYVDIAVATQTLKKEEVSNGIMACLKAQSMCNGYVFEPQVVHNKRYGNFWLDLFKFKRKTLSSGWKYKATFLVVDAVIVDKFWSGEPQVDQEKVEVNPLGLFQEMGTVITGPLLNR